MGPAIALLLSTLAFQASAAPADQPDPAAALIREAATLLLEGRDLPRDMRPRLLALEPGDRLQVIAYLRRIGLLRGAAWPVSDLLLPAASLPETE